LRRYSIVCKEQDSFIRGEKILLIKDSVRRNRDDTEQLLITPMQYHKGDEKTMQGAWISHGWKLSPPSALKHNMPKIGKLIPFTHFSPAYSIISSS
jgi:hypothetical protein